MPRVCLVGLIAGGVSGIPRYAAALTHALDRVASEFPELELELITTARGQRLADPAHIEVSVVGRPFTDANEGPVRIVAEQLAARSAQADLLHFFDLTGPLLRPRRPFTATIHDAAPMHGFEQLRMAHKRALQPWAARRARALVAVSAFAAAEAVDRLGASASRIEVVHSGPGLLPSPAAQPPASPEPYVLYVGNLAPHKNVPCLIEAFARASIPGRLIIAGGGGADLAAVRAAAQASPARDRIELRLGVSDADLDHLYRGAMMLALPSSYEGFGFTALEAMGRGCPVVASDIPALREVSGEGALFVPAGDVDAWAAALRRVATEPHQRTELIRRGAEVVGRYSWEQTAREVCRIFLCALEAQ
jgi:glycosyltransferase involved in cell wall biosynthesis